MTCERDRTWLKEAHKAGSKELMTVIQTHHGRNCTTASPSPRTVACDGFTQNCNTLIKKHGEYLTGCHDTIEVTEKMCLFCHLDEVTPFEYLVKQPKTGRITCSASSQDTQYNLPCKTFCIFFLALNFLQSSAPSCCDPHIR